MATDAQTLLAAASCYRCFGGNSESLQLMKLGLLRQILLGINANAMTDPQTLLEQATCYRCHANNGYTLELMELALLAQLVAAGGGAGGGIAGAGAPTVTYPAGPASGHEGTPYVDTLTGLIYWWYSGQWNPP